MLLNFLLWGDTVDLSPDRKFKITFAAALLVVGGAAAATWRTQAILNKIDASLSAMATRQDGLERDIGDRWSKTAAAEWALRLVINNPSIKVPDPRDPSKTLSQWGAAGN